MQRGEQIDCLGAGTRLEKAISCWEIGVRWETDVVRWGVEAQRGGQVDFGGVEARPEMSVLCWGIVRQEKEAGLSGVEARWGVKPLSPTLCSAPAALEAAACPLVWGQS